MRSSFLSLFLVLTASVASAQVISVAVIPSSPTTQTPVTLRVTALYHCTPITFLRTGNTIRVDVSPTCLVITAPSTNTDLVIGYLPVGSYTYDVYLNGWLDRTGTFAVGDAGPHGQFATITIQPAQPTTMTPVTLNVLLPSSCGPVTFTRNGPSIRVEVPNPDDCVLPALSSTPLQIGFLPAGTTMYAVYLRDGTLDSAGSFVVADSGVPSTPALSPVFLLALSALLAVAGWFALGRLASP